MNSINKSIKTGIISAAIIIILIASIAAIAVNYKNNTQNPSDSTASTSQLQTEENSVTKSTSKINKNEWNLILVNKNNPIPDSYTISLKQLTNGHAVDERCYDDLQKMMNDCRAEGLEPVICSSYRTNEKQTELYNRQIEKWKNLGYSEEDAKIEAGKLVAIPGTSEHQLGLALDIVDISYQILDENQEKNSSSEMADTKQLEIWVHTSLSY